MLVVHNSHAGEHRIPIESFLQGRSTHYLGLTGEVGGSQIRWSNGSVWSKSCSSELQSEISSNSNSETASDVVEHATACSHDQSPLEIQVLNVISGNEICVVPASRASDLKAAIHEAVGIPVSEQQLLVDGRQLRHGEVLAEILAGKDAIVSLLHSDPHGEATAIAQVSGGRPLSELDVHLCCNRSVVLAAVKRSGSNFEHAAEDH